MIIASNKIPPIWTMLWLKKKFSNQNCDSILIQILWGRKRVKRGMWNHIKPENNFAYQSNQAQVDMETQIEFSLMNFWRPCHRLPNPHLPPPPNPPLFLLVPAMCIPPLSLSNMKRKGKIFFLIGKLYTHPMGFEPTISLLQFEPKLNGRMNLFLFDCLFFFFFFLDRQSGGLSSNPRYPGTTQKMWEP